MSKRKKKAIRQKVTDCEKTIDIEEITDIEESAEIEEIADAEESAEIEEIADAEESAEIEEIADAKESAEVEENTDTEEAKESEEIQESVNTEVTSEQWGWWKRYWWCLVFAVVLLTGLCFMGYWWYECSQVYKTCSVEAGVTVTATDFVKSGKDDVYFTEESDEVDITVPGEYNLVIRKGFFKHKCKLKIVDTIAPAVEVKTIQIESGNTCEPEDFIVSIQDATDTEICFGEEPDYSNFNSQEIEILVTDAGGNTTSVRAELMILCVVETLEWEVGTDAPVISDFVLSGSDGRILTDLEEIDFCVPDSHEIKIELNDKVYKVQLHVVDTIAPVLHVKDVEGCANCSRKAEEFVDEISDVTEVTVSFQELPDVTLAGTQKVTIVAMDEGGNQTLQEAKLTLVEDTEAPIITGVTDMVTYVGESVLYKTNVQVEDMCAEAANLKVDSSQVNLNAVGSYPVTYTATDCSGNVTSITVTLTVRERVYTLDEINQLADGILSGILTEGMSPYDKVTAIFNYVKGSISYTNSSDKGNYLRAAYEGMVLKRGDCYVYASTAKALLDRAGIVNMDIERIPAGTTMHYWNLVDIGDGHGWYHFDTTPRKDHPVIFLWDDQQMKNYSDSHNNSHNYDRSVYPVIN